MCGLCGVIDADRHWTAARSVDIEGGRAERMRQRFRLAQVATRMLGATKITVEDFGGRQFVVRSATGAAELVDSLPQVWLTAERMHGRPLGLPDSTP